MNIPDKIELRPDTVRRDHWRVTIWHLPGHAPLWQEVYSSLEAAYDGLGFKLAIYRSRA